MSIQPPDASALALDAGSRHAVTGVLTPELGMQPYYDWLLETLHLLNESSCGALRVVDPLKEQLGAHGGAKVIGRGEREGLVWDERG